MKHLIQMDEATIMSIKEGDTALFVKSKRNFKRGEELVIEHGEEQMHTTITSVREGRPINKGWKLITIKAQEKELPTVEI